MKFLLDTHVFLWWIEDSPLLSGKAREIIRKGANELFWSTASSWEVVIKYHIGKLPLPDSPELFIKGELKKNRIASLTITDEHAFQAGKLDLHHKDPFDRMLIAQSHIERMPIVSGDSSFELYDVKIIW